MANAVNFTTSSVSLLETAKFISLAVEEVDQEFGIDAIFIEDFMKSYGNKSFHTQGLFKLAKLQGMIAAHLAEMTHIEPVAVMPNAIRGFFNLSDRAKLIAFNLAHATEPIDVPANKKIKYAAFDFCKEIYPHCYPFDQVKDDSGMGFPAPSSPLFDISDAIVTSLYGASRWWQFKMIMNDPQKLTQMVMDMLPVKVDRSNLLEQQTHSMVCDTQEQCLQNLQGSYIGSKQSKAGMPESQSILSDEVLKISKKTLRQYDQNGSGDTNISAFDKSIFEDLWKKTVDKSVAVDDKLQANLSRALPKALKAVDSQILASINPQSAV